MLQEKHIASSSCVGHRWHYYQQSDHELEDVPLVVPELLEVVDPLENDVDTEHYHREDVHQTNDPRLDQH